jgi:LAO/AO transport system kinase
LAAARDGDKAALGRLLSLVERGGEQAKAVGRLTIGPSAAVDQVIGLTGAPGTGKSTLTDRLIGLARQQGTVGVLAVDPSSPLSGGAILGDRVRMPGHALDDGVFIRSMATRGHHGGLALAAAGAIRLLAAAGRAVVLVETVGVGQVEVEIAGAADTTVVVVNPGWGDAVQASKAGLLEVADVFVVNKADRHGADQARQDLDRVLDLGVGSSGWRPPVLMAVASTGRGVEDVWAAIRGHRDQLEATGQLTARRNQQLVDETGRLLVRLVEQDVRALDGGRRWQQITEAVAARRLDPHEAAAELLELAGQ